MGKPKKYIRYHKDGSIWAKGWMNGATMVGAWIWYRKDGTKLRAGRFSNGKQIGEWVTYDQKGLIHKVTRMKE